MSDIMQQQEIRQAYIYSRVSKREQAEHGEGITRQIEKATSYIEGLNDSNRRNGKHIYEIVPEHIVDRGLSAYFGKNTDANAGLGGFLEAAKDGKVPVGSLLVVEAVDRISRLEADESRKIFGKFKDYKIDVAIQKFGLVIYHDQKVDMGVDLLLTAAFHLANLESEQKSIRIRASKKIARQKEKEGGKKVSSNAPAWLKLSKCECKFEVSEENALLLKRIYNSKLNGKGALVICRELNEAGIRNFKGKVWNKRLVEKYLTMQQVMGWLQPTTTKNVDGKVEKIPTGEIIKDYYPQVIDEKIFTQVQQSFKKINKGNRAKNYNNIFEKLVHCPKCGSSMRYNFTPLNRAQPKYRCYGKEKGCDQSNINYRPIRDLLVNCLAGLDYSKMQDKSFKEFQSDITLIDRRIYELENKAKEIEKIIEDTSNASAINALARQIDVTYNKVAEEQKKRDKLLSITSNYDVQSINSLDLDTPDGRLRYNLFIRSYIDYILPDGNHVKVKFKGKTGMLTFYYDSNDEPEFDTKIVSNAEIVKEVFMNGKDKIELDTTPAVRLRYTATAKEMLAEIDTVKQPDSNDYLDGLKYLFEVRREIRENSERWGHLRRYAR